MNTETDFAKALRTHPKALPNLPVIPPLSDLPVIIDEPGTYQARSGVKVVIHEVRGPGTFAAKGNWFKSSKKKVRGYVGEYSIWHVSGRHQAVGESPLDIIRKVT